MAKQPKPIIHGRDHAPGGADPIPILDLIPDAQLRLTDGTTTAGVITGGTITVEEVDTVELEGFEITETEDHVAHLVGGILWEDV